MKIAILGRGAALLQAAQSLTDAGHTVPIVWYCQSANYDKIDLKNYQQWALKEDADFFSDIKINDVENISRLKAHNLDIGFSMNWITKLSPNLLSIFLLGVYNAHAGDLPKYRGNACPNWAIINGEDHIGLCVHEMIEELDAGDVVLRDRLKLNDQSYISDVSKWIHQRVPSLFVKLANGPELLKSTSTPQPADPKDILRCYPRRPEDSEIRWSDTALNILRLIRASSRPFPGAYTVLENFQKVTIWRAAIEDPVGAFSAVPGQVCYQHDNDPVIACGKGLLRLTDVKIDGCSSSDLAKKMILKSLRNRLG